MLPKSLLLTLLLGAFSVSALPNPGAEGFRLKARDDADELAARDQKSRKCKDWEDYDWNHHQCKKRCKDWEDYDWNHHQCKKRCKDWEDYDWNHHQCKKRCKDAN
ncbi:hypothetical protein BFJ63_vAg15895 [Fusarium oxysporum f. sp. narcissi]|uniref:Uncharacterized protein n=1 Tax=Fusarium oxysporum f. sp. narcissi TaxID=451672 RepID=A0A4Q2VAM5_FUSOX|nr:hypothetical protein BFJ63_vAg15895 [Fusarium oxysporum f. sp. narcissi]